METIAVIVIIAFILLIGGMASMFWTIWNSKHLQVPTKSWKLIDSDECPICGGQLEAYTDCPEQLDDSYEIFFTEGDEVRCVEECNFTSKVEITQYGEAYVEINITK